MHKKIVRPEIPWSVLKYFRAGYELVPGGRISSYLETSV